jgi:hypothetical protein
MFYYIDMHLLARYIQWIKMHGETVKTFSLFKFVECPTVRRRTKNTQLVYAVTEILISYNF